MEKERGDLSSGSKRRTWTIVAGVAAGLAVLLAITFISPGASNGRKSAVSGVGPQRALASDFRAGGGLDERYLMGLFSESAGNILKAKVPSSEWPYVRNLRLHVKWNDVAGPHRDDPWRWESTDAQINDALSIGVNSILLTLGGPCPGYAVNQDNPGRSNKNMGPPWKMQDWGDFCGAVANRYKGYVDYYQIWQEPGWDIDAPPASSGVVYYNGYCEYSYMGMLRASYKAIKEADPNAYVYTGSLLNGLTHSESDMTNYKILLAGGNQDVSMKVHSNRNIVAERPIYFNYHGAWPGGTVELGTKNPGTTWYLAEGATHPGINEWICIQNPGDVNAGVTITYMFATGGTQNQSLKVPAHSRYTINVNDTVGPSKDVSAKVVSTQPVVVERPMYFSYQGKWDGGSTGSGVPALSDIWYLAEGATHPGIDEWISLMNPNPNPVDVTITYMFKGGGTMEQIKHMEPTSRETVLVNEVVGPDKDVSAKVKSTKPIVAERAMYFLYRGAWSGGDAQVGATAPSTSWMLAEGTTRANESDGAFEEWISIMNPGDTLAKVSLTYMFVDGTTKPGYREVPPHSRESVMVNLEVGPDKDVSVELGSDQPIVVERPMYYNYRNAIPGGDVELGCTQPAKDWYFAEGSTREGIEDWLTLQNPNASPASVEVTYMFSDGTTQKQQNLSLPAKSRTTVGVNHSISMATICDGIAVHPYDLPPNWWWYYQNLVGICQGNGYPNREVVVTEIGWAHAGENRPEFSPEIQRAAVGEVGCGELFGVGCKKIWIFQDVDPAAPWDNLYMGLWDFYSNPMPAWYEYRNWQGILQDYGNKPGHTGPFGS